MIDVLEGKDVDVIEPFPVTALSHAVSWMHNQKTLVFGDDGPQNDKEIEAFLLDRLQNVKTWGIIDKNNLTKSTASDVPIVGIGMFELVNHNNGYFHIASNRKAWGDKIAQPGLMEQAARLVITEIFEALPSLTRVSCAIIANNKAAINLARRVGFVKDGYFKEAITRANNPEDVIHLGILRRTWFAVEKEQAHGVGISK